MRPTRPFPMPRRRGAPVAALCVVAVTLLAAGCELYDGDLPPLDALHWPGSMVLHPSGSYLYILNTNFDADYRNDLGGSITVVDTETLQILPDSTRCMASYGGQLALGTSTWGVDDGGVEQPRMLVATARGDGGITAFQLSPEGDRLTCLRQGEDIGSTCVNNMADLPGVTRRRRVLPCTVPTVVGDPVAITAIAPTAPDAPDEQDAFAVIGLRGGQARMITYIDGEIRGPNPRAGDEQRRRHLTEEPVTLANGGITFATHPLTGQTYLGARFESRIRVLRWLREPVTSYDENPRAGFVSGVGQAALVQLPTLLATQEIRSIVFSDDGTRLYAIGSSPGVINVIDTSLDDDGVPRNRPLARVPVAGQPSQAVFIAGAARDRLYVTTLRDRRVLVFDADDLTRLTEIELGSQPYALLADPWRDRLYVALFEDSSVAVIDTRPDSATLNRIIATIR